jgi:2',3'-cyclic-nucleotide 2'-phosphodiesterase/3'-nucleotidase
MVAKAQTILLPPLRIQDILRDYVAGVLPKDPLEAAPQPFSLMPCPGARAILITGPGAMVHLPELSAFSPRNLGVDDTGFLRIELSL